jgi:hypothetical protein
MALQHGHWSIDPLGVLEKALQENRYLNSWIIENSRTANFAFLGEKAPPWKRLSSGSHVGAFVDWMFPTAEDSCSAAELGASEEVLRWALDKIQLSRAFADKLRIALQGAGRGGGGGKDDEDLGNGRSNKDGRVGKSQVSRSPDRSRDCSSKIRMERLPSATLDLCPAPEPQPVDGFEVLVRRYKKVWDDTM